MQNKKNHIKSGKTTIKQTCMFANQKLGTSKKKKFK